MVIEDEFVIQQPIQDVWDFFFDIPRVSGCVPGAEQVEEIEDGLYKGNLSVRIGPIAANFGGKVSIVDLDPPNRIVAKVEGRDKATASVIDGEFVAKLSHANGGYTRVQHQLDVVVRGRLGQFGTGVIQEVAKEMTKAFVVCVQHEMADTAKVKGSPITNVGAADAVSNSENRRASGTADTPSLLTIIVRAVIQSIGNALRRLLSRFSSTGE